MTPDAPIVIGPTLLLLAVSAIFVAWSAVRDARERRRMRELEDALAESERSLTELDRQRSGFVSLASHQLRAPLAAIRGYSSLMLDGDMGKLPAAARLGVERIYRSAGTLVGIVDDYLDVSRLELGGMKYVFEAVDLRELVEEVVEELRPIIDGSGVPFSFQAEAHDAGYRTTADHDKLKQVIANLIDNSVKYTPSGSVTVTLSFDHAAQTIRLEVRDTGIGIDPEALPSLFRKFSRADNASRMHIHGTGLGLYVAKEIVDAHHGSIAVASSGEGKGSTFTVELEPFMAA